MKIIYQNLIYLLGSVFILLSSAYAGNGCTNTYTPQVFQGYFNSPDQMTTDGIGNVWVRNLGDNSITKISVNNSIPPVVYQGASHKFSSPFSITADLIGNLWVLNGREKNVTKLPVENPGAPLVYGLGNSTSPRFIAVDTSGNVWVVDGISRKLIKLPQNNPQKPVEITRPEFKINVPIWNLIADKSGNIWISTAKNMDVFVSGGVFSKSYSVFSGPKYQIPSKQTSSAIDSDSNFYAINSETNSVIKINAANPSADPVIYSGPSYQFQSPSTIAVDPQGNVWVANTNTVTEIPVNSPTVPIIFDPNKNQFGYLGGLIADVKGNIWLSNSSLNTVTELILSPSSC